MEGHVEVFHSSRSNMINNKTPYFCLGTNITLLHQVLVLCGCEGATLQHIPNLLADPAIVTAGQSVPKLLL